MKLLSFFIVAFFLTAAQGKTFSVDNCVRVDVEGTFEVEAMRDGQKELTLQMDVSKTPFTVSGSCLGFLHLFTVHFNSLAIALDWTMVFDIKAGHASMDQMVKFIPSSLFHNGSLPEEPVALAAVGETMLSLTNESFACRAERTIPYSTESAGGYNFTLVQVIRNFQAQAFSLNGTTFSPAENCSDDHQNVTTAATTAESTTAVSTAATSKVMTTPSTTVPSSTNATTAVTTAATTAASTAEMTTVTETAESTAAISKVMTTIPSTAASTAQPITTTPSSEHNMYVVYNQLHNVSCIVLQGDIAFKIIYDDKIKGQSTAAVSIPRMNTTTANVIVSGSCGSNSSHQQMMITFNGNWNLTLTFARGSDEASSMLGATKVDEYSLHDIQFEYTLIPEFFINASKPGDRYVARAENLNDFLQGSVNGGSYKCMSKITQPLDPGVTMETTNLQYKAFNTDNNTSFSDSDVSECPADKGNDNTVAIAVGASLGGLIVIVFISYLIGRRRRHRAGYDAL